MTSAQLSMSEFSHDTGSETSIALPVATTLTSTTAKTTDAAAGVTLTHAPANQASLSDQRVTVISTPSLTRKLQGMAKWEALVRENTIPEPRPLLRPTRRVCVLDLSSNLGTIERAKRSVFITDDEIREIHPMRFLRKSPFVKPIPTAIPGEEMWFQMLEDHEWEPILDEIIKTLHAIGCTENGKHVILQQAIKSCVPACVAMLVLDHGKTPNYLAIERTNLANEEAAIAWVREAGLKPKMTQLRTKAEATQKLPELLKDHGPGVFGIKHPVVANHVIVLDAISIADNQAMIRDSFHGWALTMRLDALLSWVDEFSYFLQIDSTEERKHSQ